MNLFIVLAFSSLIPSLVSASVDDCSSSNQDVYTRAYQEQLHYGSCNDIYRCHMKIIRQPIDEGMKSIVQVYGSEGQELGGELGIPAKGIQNDPRAPKFITSGRICVQRSEPTLNKPTEEFIVYHVIYGEKDNCSGVWSRIVHQCGQSAYASTGRWEHYHIWRFSPKELAEHTQSDGKVLLPLKYKSDLLEVRVDEEAASANVTIGRLKGGKYKTMFDATYLQ
jgi:hypothetical protein